MRDLVKNDSASALFKRATDILFMQDPVATAMGVMCGGSLHVTAVAFKPLWEKSKIIDLSNVSIYSFVLLGIFICNLVAISFHLFRRRSLPAEIEDELTVIRLAIKEGNLSEYQIRAMYISLFEKVLRDVEVKLDSDISSKKKSLAKRRRPSSE